MASGAARGEVAWHADLYAARAACGASGKPVLVVFQASWDAAAADPATDVLASPEVEAVVAACFEPVRLDVDKHADLARHLAVEHVPAARVLDRDAALLASFDCPATPSEFVASAARAAQMAAAGNATGVTASIAAATDAFGTLGRAEHETASAVSAKVRKLSDFADGQDSAAPLPQQPGDLAAALAAPPADVGSRYSEPPATPALAAAPPWRTQPTAAVTADPVAVAPPAAPTSPPVQASLEPQPSAATSWLAGSQPAPATATPSAQPAGAAAGVTAADQATAAAQPPATELAAKPQSGFWAAVQKPWSIFSKSATKPASEAPAPPPTMPPARPQWPAALTRVEPTVDQLGPMPLGLEGYCPVTVVERNSWVEGRPQWGARHRGRTYLFAGPEQQQAFLADPDRYAPALSGDDPVLAFDSGKCTPGQRRYGVTYQSRMYLFSSSETRDAFAANPHRYTAGTFVTEKIGSAAADGTVVR
ncbi:MAG: thioredoxin family protein [Planctomycetota bacterium]